MDAWARRLYELSLRRSGSSPWELLARLSVQELQTMSDGAIALLSAVDESLAKS